jgi:hypothetical protein
VGISSSTIGGHGVFGGHTAGGTGVVGESTGWMGVYGKTDSTTGGAGVMGEGVAGGPGVIGKSQHWHGLYGETSAGGATGAAAVWGENKSDGSGVVGHSVNGAGVYAKSDNGAAAVLDGKVEVHGDIEVSGDIRLLNADVAEMFETDVATGASPGTVMSLDESGRIRPSRRAYDRKVVGIVAGAGAYRPGLVLDSGLSEGSRPIAVIGKVHCKADASYGPIQVGDLLTTSPNVGHAMKADDASQAFGAVLGKALSCLGDGQGLITVMVSLQ